MRPDTDAAGRCARTGPAGSSGIGQRRPSAAARTLRRRCGGGVLLALACVLLPGAAKALTDSDPADLCEAAALRAAARHDVPVPVMLAVAHVETGRAGPDGRVRPWPWAVNTGGQGHWAPTRAAALALARAARARGQDSFDLGCFQINHRWHGARFASLDAMLDPQANADYAARLLVRLHARHGTWRAAVGAYHSATPTLAVRYLERFDRALAAQTADAADIAPPPRAAAMRGRHGAAGSRALIALHGAPAGPGSVVALVPSEAPAGPSPAPVAAGGVALGMLR